jgi:hypothetical protein
MNIEDCKIGTKVKLISTEVTDEYLGYSSTGMFSIGSVSEVIDFGDGYDGCENVKLSDGSWYAVDDLELLKVPEKETAKLTVSVSVEDKEEIAKDILKIVLKDLNVIITDAIDSLSNDSLSDDSLSNGNEEVKQPLDVPTVTSNVDFSDEKLQSMFEEVMKDVMKEYLQDSINTLNKTAFGILI